MNSKLEEVFIFLKKLELSGSKLFDELSEFKILEDLYKFDEHPYLINS
jgi:hypothetical protein